MMPRITDAIFARIVQRAFQMELLSERDAGRLVGLIVKGSLEEAAKHARAAMGERGIDLHLLADLDLIARRTADARGGARLRGSDRRGRRCFVSACRWLQIESVEEGVEAICTVGSFFAANEGLAFAREEAEALRPGEGFGLGGGAAPEYMVEALTEERAKALDEIERLLQGAIEVQVDDGSDPDSGALPYSIWFDDQIIGADTTLDRTIEDALETARRWDGERKANAKAWAADAQAEAIMGWEKRSDS